MIKIKHFLGMLLVFCLALGLLPNTTFAANSHHPFTDVSDTAWYSRAVQYVYENDMMNGTSSIIFSPDTSTSRGMIVTILHRIEKSPAASGMAFADVPVGQWYTDAVIWASANGIVNGYDNGNFGPDDPITREQMATILYRYAGYKGYDVNDIVSLSDFTDANTVSDWAETAMKWAVGEEIITGVTETTIGPAETATRAQAATILMRLCTRIEALQAFQEKDIEDFEGFGIINFDESNETNFAVLVEGTIAAETTKDSNRLISSDEENGVFVFSNINEQIAGLTAGDVLYITYGDNEEDYLLLKVGSIEVKGDTATITEGEAKLSDYFEYIDVDMEVGVGSDDFDPSSADSGVTYEGTSEQKTGTPRLFSALYRSVGGDASTEFKFGVNTGTINATVSVKLTLSVKIKYDKTIFDVEEVKISVKQENTIEGKLTGSATGKEDTYKKSLGKATIPICAGLDAEIEVYAFFDLDLSASVTVKVKTTAENGAKFSNGKTTPIDESEFEISINAGGKFNASIGIGMDIGVTGMKVLKISLGAEAGLEFDAKADFIDDRFDLGADPGHKLEEISDYIKALRLTEWHECRLCIDGAVNIYGELSFKIKLGFTEKFSVTLVDIKLADAKIHLADFYISFLNEDIIIEDAVAEFGWGDCPHKRYLVTVCVSDYNESSARVEIVDSDGRIVDTGNVNSDGIFESYCANGFYIVYAFGADGYSNVQKELSVNDKAVEISLFIIESDQPEPTPTPVPIPAPDSDFVIENGVLTRYTGQGGVVTIPDGVTSIGDYAFGSSLTSVTIPNSVISIGDNAFYYCNNLTSVTIPDSVTSIGYEAFAWCTSLTSVTVGNRVTSIGGWAFANCFSLVSVTIPNSVTSIGNHAFAGCDGLINLTIPNSVTIIDEGVFDHCNNLTSVIIPNSITSIGDEAFWGCSSLTSVTIPNSVTSIGDNAFRSCSSLTNVLIPNSVTSIGYAAFSGCSSLTSVTIPTSVVSIGMSAFEESNLTDVYYDGNKEQWEQIYIDDVFGVFNRTLRNATIHFNS